MVNFVTEWIQTSSWHCLSKGCVNCSGFYFSRVMSRYCQNNFNDCCFIYQVGTLRFFQVPVHWLSRASLWDTGCRHLPSSWLQQRWYLQWTLTYRPIHLSVSDRFCWLLLQISSSLWHESNLSSPLSEWWGVCPLQWRRLLQVCLRMGWARLFFWCQSVLATAVSKWWHVH